MYWSYCGGGFFYYSILLFLKQYCRLKNCQPVTGNSGFLNLRKQSVLHMPAKSKEKLPHLPLSTQTLTYVTNHSSLIPTSSPTHQTPKCLLCWWWFFLRETYLISLSTLQACALSINHTLKLPDSQSAHPEKEEKKTGKCKVKRGRDRQDKS